MKLQNKQSKQFLTISKKHIQLCKVEVGINSNEQTPKMLTTLQTGYVKQVPEDRSD